MKEVGFDKVVSIHHLAMMYAIISLQITNIMGPDIYKLGPVHYSQGTIYDWFHHVAVIKDGTVFDSMTGSKGMPLDEYKKMFEYEDILNFEETKTITCK